MKTSHLSGLPLVGLLLVITFLLSSQPLSADTNSLSWQKQDNLVNADIQSWNLVHLLENIAAATGWRGYLDPKANHTVSAKFKALPPGEALPLLLGDVNFAVVPQTNGPSRLYVFRTS